MTFWDTLKKQTFDLSINEIRLKFSC